MSSREAVDALLEDWQQRGRDLDHGANIRWYAEEIIREADQLWRDYGPPPGPGDRVTKYLAMVRHFVETACTETPGTGASCVGEGRAAPVLGPATDIAVDDDISHAFDDLKTTDEERP